MHIKDVSIKINVCILGENKLYIYIYIWKFVKTLAIQ